MSTTLLTLIAVTPDAERLCVANAYVVSQVQSLRAAEASLAHWTESERWYRKDARRNHNRTPDFTADGIQRAREACADERARILVLNERIDEALKVVEVLEAMHL